MASASNILKPNLIELLWTEHFSFYQFPWLAQIHLSFCHRENRYKLEPLNNQEEGFSGLCGKTLGKKVLAMPTIPVSLMNLVLNVNQSISPKTVDSKRCHKPLNVTESAIVRAKELSGQVGGKYSNC